MRRGRASIRAPPRGHQRRRHRFHACLRPTRRRRSENHQPVGINQPRESASARTDSSYCPMLDAATAFMVRTTDWSSLRESRPLHAPRGDAATRRRPRAPWTRERARRSSSTCCALRWRKSASPPGRTVWSGSRSSARLRMARWRSTWILCRCSLGWRPRSRRRERIRCVTPGFSPAPASCARAWCLRRPRRRLRPTSKRASLTNVVAAIGPGPSFSPRWASRLSRARSARAACACSGSCVRRTTFGRGSPPWARPPSPRPSSSAGASLLGEPRASLGEPRASRPRERERGVARTIGARGVSASQGRDLPIGQNEGH